MALGYEQVGSYLHFIGETMGDVEELVCVRVSDTTATWKYTDGVGTRRDAEYTYEFGTLQKVQWRPGPLPKHLQRRD